MTQSQRVVLSITGGVFILNLLVPPWYFDFGKGPAFDAGYAFILSPPTREASPSQSIAAQIAFARLALQALVIAVIGGAAYLLTLKQSQGSTSSSGIAETDLQPQSMSSKPSSTVATVETGRVEQQAKTITCSNKFVGWLALYGLMMLFDGSKFIAMDVMDSSIREFRINLQNKYGGQNSDGTNPAEANYPLVQESTKGSMLPIVRGIAGIAVGLSVGIFIYGYMSRANWLGNSLLSVSMTASVAAVACLPRFYPLHVMASVAAAYFTYRCRSQQVNNTFAVESVPAGLGGVASPEPTTSAPIRAASVMATVTLTQPTVEQLKEPSIAVATVETGLTATSTPIASSREPTEETWVTEKSSEQPWPQQHAAETLPIDREGFGQFEVHALNAAQFFSAQLYSEVLRELSKIPEHLLSEESKSLQRKCKLSIQNDKTIQRVVATAACAFVVFAVYLFTDGSSPQSTPVKNRQGLPAGQTNAPPYTTASPAPHSHTTGRVKLIGPAPPFPHEPQSDTAGSVRLIGPAAPSPQATARVVYLGPSQPQTTINTGGNHSVAAVSPADKADAYMQGIVDAVGRGDAATMWNALPPKYQADVTSLKNEFAAKMDADLWNKAFVVAGKLATLLKDKKAMILASPIGAQVPPPIKIMAEANWDTVASSLTTVVNSEIKTLDGLKSAEPGKFLSSTGTTLVTSVLKALESTAPEAAEGMAKVRKSKVVLVKQEGDVAVLMLEVEGEPKAEEKTFRKVDGKWLPAEMVDSWDATMTNAKTELAGLTITPEMKAQFNGAVGMVEPILDKLIAAKDQAAFDGEVQGLMAIAAMFGGGPSNYSP